MLLTDGVPTLRRVEMLGPRERGGGISFRGYLYRLTYEKKDQDVVRSWTVELDQRGHGNQTHHKTIERLEQEGLEQLKRRKCL